MRLILDPRLFSTERERFSLRFCCEDCIHFFEDTEHCASGWPTEEHRQSRYTGDTKEIVFCKEFELR